jgi:hypothetical protein
MLVSTISMTKAGSAYADNHVERRRITDRHTFDHKRCSGLVEHGAALSGSVYGLGDAKCRRPDCVVRQKMGRDQCEYAQRSLDAILAPSTKDSSLAHCTEGWHRTML